MRSPMAVQEMVRRRVRRRRLLRRVRIGLLVVAIVVACGAAAFGIDRMVVSLHRYYAGHPGTTTSTTAAGAIRVATTTTTPGPPSCASAQLNADVYYWIGSGTSIYEILTLGNISGTPCTLVGYPTLGASAANGTPLPAPTADVPALGSVPGGTPTSTGPVTVAPGTRAWFELSFPDECNQVLQPGATPSGATGTCYGGTDLQVTPPRASSPLLVTEPLHFDYGTSGFDVGPFQGGYPPRTPPVPATTTPAAF